MWSNAVLTATTLLAGILALAYIFFTWTFDHWENIPHLKPVPFFGNFNFILRKSIGDFLRETYSKFPNNEYYGIWMFRKPALVIRSPELARRVLVKDFDNFNNRFMSSGSTDPLGALNILTANDPLWSKVRRKLTPVFTSAKIRLLHVLINECSKELMARIRREHVQLNKPVHLRELLGRFTADVIGAAAFGVECDCLKTDDSLMLRLTRDIATFNWRRGIEFCSIFYYPYLIDIFRFKFYPRSMTAQFRDIFWTIAKERSKEPATSRDLMDVLLEIRRDFKANGDELIDDVYVAQAAIFLQGGFDTTSVAMSYLFLELAHHPAQKQRLYEELKQAKDRTDREFEFNDIKELPYLDMCIKETLRKYLPSSFLDRIADRDYKVDDNLTIKRGTPIYINAIGMHYDEKYFPDPYTWDPERFSPENAHLIVPYTYLPFGEGPRNCIGMRFAQLAMRSVAVHTLLDFDLLPKPGQPKPEDIPFDCNAVFLAPKVPIDIQFVERK